MSGAIRSHGAGSGCPDLEHLAAFLDGRLSGAERDRMVSHVEGCERCYEIFSETLRFREEERPAGRVALHPAARRRWVAWAAAAAAALVLLVATPVRRLLLGPADPAAGLEVGRLAGELLSGGDAAALVAAAARDPGWSRVRGTASIGLDEGARSFRLGVRLVDLEVALRGGDAAAAIRHLDEVEDLVASFDLSEAVAAAYRDLRSRLDAGEIPEELSGLSGQAATAAAALGDPERSRLGRWSEAARLAAATGDAGYFRRPEVGRAAEHLAAAELGPAVVEGLAALSETIREGVEAADLPELERSLGRLIVSGANRG